METIQILGLISMIIRIIGIVFGGMVLYKQIKLRTSNYNDNLNTLRERLIILSLIPLSFAFLATYNNYLRFVDKMQNEFINNLSFVLGAISATVSAMILWLIYRNSDRR